MKFDISQYAFKYLTNSLTPQEQEELNTWLMNPYNKLQFESFVDKKTVAKGILKRSEMDSSQSWNKLANKTVRKHRLRNVLSYAAVITLPISVALFTFNLSDTSLDVKKVANHIEVLKYKGVVLKTHNGKSYSITSTDTIIKTEDSEIIVKNKQIIYDSTPSKSLKLKYNTLSIPRGSTYELILPDRSKVWLNSDTEFKYPTSFSNNKRVVYLTKGEAFFEVEKNEKKPFTVQFKGSSVEVLGTKFNVRSYVDSKTNAITLEEGSIILKNNYNLIKLVPNQQAIVANNSIHIKRVDASLFGSWRSGQLNYKDQSLESIMNDLQRHYNMKVLYQDKIVMRKRFSISLEKGISIEQILNGIQRTGKIKFQINGKTIIIGNN